jgi:hypothetical protein
VKSIQWLIGFADLKNFFSSINSTSGSNSGPSTHESGNVVVADSFSMFDVEKIAPLTEIYGQDFSIVDRSNISYEYNQD